MGYTHYWKIESPLRITAEQGQLIREVLKEYAPILTVEAKTAEGWFKVNGLEEDDQQHEDFLIEFKKATEFEFCKTARKPYDLPVCKLLCILALSKDFSFSSDGLGVKEDDTLDEDENWGEAFDWIKSKGHDLRESVIAHLKAEREEYAKEKP